MPWHRKSLRDFCWAYRPSKEGFARLAAFVGTGGALEVGSGRGLWGELYRRFVNENGSNSNIIEIGAWICTDAEPPRPTFGVVEQMDGLTAVAKYVSCQTLVLCWPPYLSPLAHDALRAFRGLQLLQSKSWGALAPQQLIYVGEGPEGCTGDARFHALLEREWQLVTTIEINRWMGIYDDCELYRRK